VHLLGARYISQALQ